MNERRIKLEAVFHAAMDIVSHEERELYLSEKCRHDSGLRREVDELLKSSDAADAVFEAGRKACDVPKINGPAIVTEKAGDKIGRYKLLEQIGEGGMGVVYMAEQEEPVRRKVAFKIIKLGMDTKQVVARFEAERQALALMDHPHIAKVLDAGATENGRPFFVMELVEGVPITEFCVAKELSIEDRLKLFIAVSQAIQSAHQKGVIHRDIKPSNVLVTMHNGQPHPMVIDFGVAKATNQKLTEKTLFTNFATMIGTPAYMSPEQAEMSKTDVDTRSDIYSLGVLLYELLTGSAPFPEERLRSVAYSEMQRIIVEEEPERPSTRLKSKSLVALTSQNPRRSSLAADLDWIVMKCLEKDRDRRYDTANELGADIQRHLDTEPIIARPPSALYRFQKLMRRNKLQFAAAAFCLTVLLVAIAASVQQAVRAKRSEQSAQKQARNAEFIKDFLVRQFLAVNPYVDTAPDPNRRALLERMARAVENEFSERPVIEAELRMALAEAFITMGDPRQGAAQAEKAYTIRQKILGPQDSETLWALSGMAQANLSFGRRREMEPLLTNALAVIRSVPHEWSSGEGEILYTYAMCLNRDKPAEALPLFQEAMSVLARTMDRKNFKFQNKLHTQAYLLTNAERWNEAEALFAEGIPESVRDHGAESVLTAQFRKIQANYFMQRGRWAEARTNLEQIVPIYHRALGTNHGNGLDAEGLLARVYEHEGRIDEAAKIYGSLYPRWAKLLPYGAARDHCDTIASFFVKQRTYHDAKAAFEALRVSWENNPPENIEEMENFIKATAATKGWLAAAALWKRNLDAFPDSLVLWLKKAWIFRYVGDEESYRAVVKRVLSMPASLASANVQHVPIEIAALGEFPFTPEETGLLDAMMAELQRALPGRATDQKIWGYRSIGHLQLQLGRLDQCLASLEKSASHANVADPSQRFIKAICLHRMGRADEARMAFAQAEGMIKEKFDDPVDAMEEFLPAWQVYQCRLMHREAQALLATR